jgi:hypothetical protein
VAALAAFPESCRTSDRAYTGNIRKSFGHRSFFVGGQKLSTNRPLGFKACADTSASSLKQSRKFSGYGGSVIWGANVKTVADLNRHILNQAPGTAIAMLEYKASEAKIKCKIIKDTKPKISNAGNASETRSSQECSVADVANPSVRMVSRFSAVKSIAGARSIRFPTSTLLHCRVAGAISDRRRSGIDARVWRAGWRTHVGDRPDLRCASLTTRTDRDLGRIVLGRTGG